MENAVIYWIMIFLLIVGGILISDSITGNLVSESCCFGDNCPAENMCDSVNAGNNIVQENPAAAAGRMMLMIFGLFMISIVVLYAWKRFGD